MEASLGSSGRAFTPLLQVRHVPVHLDNIEVIHLRIPCLLACLLHQLSQCLITKTMHVRATV